MDHITSSAATGVARVALAVLTACFLSACASTVPGPDTINDPFENTNRSVHAFNRQMDRAIVGPASRGFGASVPEPAKRVIGNLANTVDLPGDIVNNVLQLNIDDAATNTLRLATNLTMGVLGIFDAATALGLPNRPTDFGQTLHVWGVAEGPFLEIPFTGPTTLRDATGTVVDLLANPVANVLPAREAFAANVLKVLSRLRDRDRFASTVESVLYDSADSYAQARLIFLQSRRFQLGQLDQVGEETADDLDSDFIDPYEDPYAE
jgi:phospholipid-binding lipoprotein MlaA